MHAIATIEILRLIVAGHTYDDIMKELRIPRRTFFRYLKLLIAEDIKRLDQTNEAEA